MKDINRRSFLKLGVTGLACQAAALYLPMALPRMALASPGSNSFTIAVISDTQNYADGRYQPASNGVVNLPFFTDQARYLVDNARTLNLAFVSHVGDVVQNGDGTTMNFPGQYGTPVDTEWRNAKTALDILSASGIPFGLTPGNHDYDNMDYSGSTNKYPPLVSSALWQNWWGSGSEYFMGKSWYGGASDSVGYTSTGDSSVKGMWRPAGTPCNYGLSSYQLFSACGKKFVHICLEMEAGNPALAWAQGVIDLYPGYPTIVTTHSYLSPPSANDNNVPLAVAASRNSVGYMNNSPGGWNSAQQVWDKFLKLNDQIFMVLCGHSWGTTRTVNGVKGLSKAENIRIDNNNSGNPVYQILSDYQGNTTLGSAGGDGWYRFMQFDMDSGNIHFYTYNAYNGAYAGQAVNPATGQSDFYQPQAFSDFSLPIPEQVLNGPDQVSIAASSFVYSRSTRLYTGNLTLTNTSVNPITSPVAVALNSLTSGVTLVNGLGSHGGSPYTTVPNGGLASNASLVVPVQFSNPANARIDFTPVMFLE